MRFRGRPALVAALVGASLLTAQTPLFAQQAPPARFFGSLTIDGQEAPMDTEVKAFINGNECGVTRTAASGSYILDVRSSVGYPGCGTEGAAISFQVNGIGAAESGSFDTGYFKPLDLTMLTGAPLPPPIELSPAAPEPTEQPPSEPPSEEAPPAE